MLTNARQKIIESIALRDGEVIISKVAKELDVSIETVRRDINAMCKKNLLTKVHGGAIPVGSVMTEPSYVERQSSNSDIKKKLGAEAVKLIKSNAVISIATGSTMEAIAANIAGVHDVTVLTNALPIAGILTEKKDRDLYDGKIMLFGGQVQTYDHLTYGPGVLEQISRFYADIAFVSVGALSGNALMNSNIESGVTTEAMLKNAAYTVLVLDSSKFGKQSVYRFADLGMIREIITDNEHRIPHNTMEIIKKRNIKLRVINVKN